MCSQEFTSLNLKKEIFQPQSIAEIYPESINPTQAKTKKK
jgi:hypothetical protein